MILDRAIILMKTKGGLMANDTETSKSSRRLNKHMLERLIMIHNLVKSGVYPNVDHIIRFYNEKAGKIGRATVYRDIEVLRVEFGAPLYFDRAKNGYYYADDNWDFALNQISPTEVFYLSAAKTLLSNFSGTPMYKEISEVIDFITDTQMQGKSAMLRRIAVTVRPKVLVDDAVWQKVMTGIRENRILEFDYNGRWRTQTTHRRLHPFQILLEDGKCCVFGFDENATDKFDKDKCRNPEGAERVFMLSRISNLKLTDENFELPEDFEFSTRCSGGRFGAFLGDRKLERYRIEFYGDARRYVKECIWADDQEIAEDEEEGTTTITFSSIQRLKVKEWVLSMGKNARPLEPGDFVEQWREEIGEMAENAGLEIAEDEDC